MQRRPRHIWAYAAGFCKGLRVTQVRNFMFVCWAIFRKRTTVLSELARCFSQPRRHIHRLKRIWRFVSNPRFNFQAVMDAICLHNLALALKAGGRRGLAKDFLPPTDRRSFYPNARYGADKNLKVNFIAIRRGQATWLLATSLTDFPRAAKLYEQRMQIEQTFRDFKSLLGLSEVRVRGVRRLQVLLVALMAVYKQRQRLAARRRGGGGGPPQPAAVA